MGERRDTGGIERLQLGDVTQDAAEVIAQAINLLGRKGKRGQGRNMLDVGSRDGGGLAHRAPLPARRGAQAWKKYRRARAEDTDASLRCYRRQEVAGMADNAETLLITGGCGFIGSNLIRQVLAVREQTAGRLRVVNLDKLTYAGRLENLADVADDSRYYFVRGDICDRALVEGVFREHRPFAVVHLAAESHVDRSITQPEAFVRTNVEGTLVLLDAARHFWMGLSGQARQKFRFLHVSTDEVYGSLEPEEPAFTELSPYAPRSPYAASKAAADHLVRAFAHTYGLPAMVSNCTNNYGSYQLPEKLIPLLIRFALEGRGLPVYGDGQQVRDWLHVEDHCRALMLMLERGHPGETYNVGGGNQRTNLAIVQAICRLLDEKRPLGGHSYAEQIRFVADRPGHDRRYAIDAGKLRSELGWQPLVQSLDEGLARTVDWYLAHEGWTQAVSDGAYGSWIAENYGWREG